MGAFFFHRRQGRLIAFVAALPSTEDKKLGAHVVSQTLSRRLWPTALQVTKAHTASNFSLS